MSAAKNTPEWKKAAREADLTLALPGGIPMFFRRIPKEDFSMGSRGCGADEEPIHRVRIADDFYLGTFLVTQEQYRAVAAHCVTLKSSPDPSQFKGPNRPVEQVSWFDACAFCHWLENGSELPHEISAVRLPTEAEWECACRAGSDTEYNTGDGEAALAEAGWFEGNSGDQTHPVGLKQPNGHGLYDMHGNVWEWCRDIFDANAYRKRIVGWAAREWVFADAGKDAQTWESRTVTEQNATRVLRGGSWNFTAN